MKFSRLMQIGGVCGFAIALFTVARMHSTPAAAANTRAPEVNYFTANGDQLYAHFRVRYWGESDGEQKDAQNGIHVVKTYLKTEPMTADFFVQPGNDRSAIAQDVTGRRLVIYFGSLRLTKTGAEASSYGLANNCGVKGPGSRLGSAGSVTRYEPPYMEPFEFGKQMDVPMTEMVVSNSKDNYYIAIQHHFELTLLDASSLSKLIQDDPGLDNKVTDTVRDEARTDLGR